MDHIERLREMRAPYACMAESHEGEPDGETFAACVAAIDAAITALSARASAGEGGDWVMVPREPTAAMFRAQVMWALEPGDAPPDDEFLRDNMPDFATGYAAMLAAAPQPQEAPARMSAWVGEMKTSAGTDFYVCVGRDTGNPLDRTYLTPNKYSIRGRAEYDVAEWNHLLGHGPKPDILAFDTDTTPPAHGDGEDLHHAVWSIVRPYIQPAAREKVNAALKESLTTRPTPEARDAARPKSREVARIGDMHPAHAMRVGLDGDGDAYVSTTAGVGDGIEFCTVGAGGGKSPKTHAALIALMVAMEEDNAADPRRDWWAKRNAALALPAQGEGKECENCGADDHDGRCEDSP